MLEATGDPEAGVVEHEADVEVGGRLGEPLGRAVDGEIERHDAGLDVVARLEIGRQGAQALLAPRRQHEVDALCGERPRKRLADARRGPGHDRPPTVGSEHSPIAYPRPIAAFLYPRRQGLPRMEPVRHGGRTLASPERPTMRRAVASAVRARSWSACVPRRGISLHYAAAICRFRRSAQNPGTIQNPHWGGLRYVLFDSDADLLSNGSTGRQIFVFDLQERDVQGHSSRSTR